MNLITLYQSYLPYYSHCDDGEVGRCETRPHEQGQVLVPGPLKHRHLFLETVHLMLASIGHEEMLGGHLPVPVAPVHLADPTTLYALPQTDVIKRNAPFVYHTVTMLLEEMRRRGLGGGEGVEGLGGGEGVEGLGGGEGVEGLGGGEGVEGLGGGEGVEGLGGGEGGGAGRVGGD